MDFEWDNNKAHQNIEKHGIDFLNAIDVFDDPFALIELDPYEYESRRRIIGCINDVTIILVVFTIREDYVYRITSARRANKNERQRYNQSFKES